MANNPHESAARAAKVLEIVAEVEKLAAEQRFTLGNVALATALSSETFDWQSLADRVTLARVERGNHQRCGLPSDETRALVVAHFNSIRSPEEKAVLQLAGAGA